MGISTVVDSYCYCRQLHFPLLMTVVDHPRHREVPLYKFCKRLAPKEVERT